MKHSLHGKIAASVLLKCTDERESPQIALPARENSSLGFIEAVHQY